jgi:hypothetical protein
VTSLYTNACRCKEVANVLPSPTLFTGLAQRCKIWFSAKRTTRSYENLSVSKLIETAIDTAVTVKLLKSKVTLLNTCEKLKMTHETQRDFGNESKVNETCYCETCHNLSIEAKKQNFKYVSIDHKTSSNRNLGKLLSKQPNNPFVRHLFFTRKLKRNFHSNILDTIKILADTARQQSESVLEPC